MIWIALLGVVLVAAQVSHQSIQPQVVQIHVGVTTKKVPSNVAFSAKFKALGYDIGGRIYQTNQGLIDSTLFDSNNYNQSKSCILYKSQLKLNVVRDLRIEKSWNTQSIITSDKLKSMFAIMSNDTYSQSKNKNIERLLVRYEFDRNNLFKSQTNISIAKLGLNASEELDIKVIAIPQIERVIVTDGVKFVSVNYQNFTQFKTLSVDSKGAQDYTYQFATKNDLFKFTLCHYSQQEGFGIIFMAWKTVLRVYNIINDGAKLILDQQLRPPTDSFFTDAIPDYGRYWALTNKQQFIAFRPNEQQKSKYDISIVKLQSQLCTMINKYGSTIHIICQESGLKYVAEMFLNQSFKEPTQALKLNRYFNSIDDARLIFRFGQANNPKLIIAGDNDLMVVPYAINREVLLQSPYNPRQTRLRSLGVELIHFVPEISNQTHSYAIGVGQYFLTLFILIEQPPEMECKIVRRDDARQFNLLVQLNSSSCIANGDKQQLRSICTYQFPFNIYPSMVEVDAASHKTIVAAILALLLAIAIFIVGCGFYCRGNMQRAKIQFMKKIQAIKRKRGSKPKPI